MNSNKNIPKTGIAGLKENYSADMLSGFLVFLLAMPLSLGIAGASEFPPIYGLITALIGGIVVSFFSGSYLTIKGPAAGLIVIVAGAVMELGNGSKDAGWPLALGAVVVAGVIQILFGILKLGKISDVFPLSAVHGMLAAIGIIIMSKQLHILAGVDAKTHEGKPMVEPLELLGLLPHTLMHFFKNFNAALIGIVSLAIVFIWPKIKNNFVKKIPAPLVVLIVAIPLGIILKLDKPFLLNLDKNLFDAIGINVSFAGMSQTGTFIKYVIMFALVGSLEALLTVKASDILDPYSRKSNYNKDLIAVGAGNIIAGILGGLPMICEVARTSANISNKAKTQWSNFFHGVFILIFLIFATSFSGLIPKPALAAMLIGVGYKLASPKEFKHMFHIGWEQFLIFIITIVASLSTDLLIGIASGMLTKIIFELAKGAPLKNIFKSNIAIMNNTINVAGSAVFSNYIGIKNAIESFKKSESITINFSNCKYVDHTVQQNLLYLAKDFTDAGGKLQIIGMDNFTSASNSHHPESAKHRKD